MPAKPLLIGIPIGLSTAPVVAEIASRSGSDPATVLAVFVSMLDQSSQGQSFGSLDGFDPTTACTFLGIERISVDLIVDAMHAVGLIETRVTVNWTAIDGVTE